VSRSGFEIRLRELPELEVLTDGDRLDLKKSSSYIVLFEKSVQSRRVEISSAKQRDIRGASFGQDET
jgi:hypothetical protein